LILEAIAGPDPEDASNSGRRFHAESQRNLGGLRVGFAEGDFDEWPEPGARQPLQAALETIKKMGIRVRDVALPDFPFGAAAGTIISAEGSTVFESLILSEKLELLADERQKAGLRAGLEIPASEYLKAMRVRRIAQEKLRALFRDVDLILAPSLPHTAPRIDEPLDQRRSAETSSAGNQELLAASNLAGLPALSLPCGFAENGLPVAIQFVARAFDEAALVAIGKEFQRRTDWHRQRPPLATQAANSK
jgi:aspartyl-tRNA(Asn)/glutamyl-tRNA(Gln) amidotransferase subunit A